jgi:DNA-binding CsgD family transcriptional regulator
MLQSSQRSIGSGKTDPGRPIPLGLTRREVEVLLWLAEGKTNYEIGVILGAASGTIRKHVEHILSKLNVENRTAAAAIAFACSAKSLISFKQRSAL